MRKDKQPEKLAFIPITLENDSGAGVSFNGALYAQTSFFEEDTGVLTKQELYVTDDGGQAFSIVSTDGDRKQRAAYLVHRDGDVCTMFNGEQEMKLPYEWLIMYTQALWDIDLERQRVTSDGLGLAQNQE